MMLIPKAAHERIIADLDRVEREERVRVLFAVESGSRAWGFPSPDSDYDARFLYVRSEDWYLSLEPGRDVIELSIEGDFDTNGWDVRKALLLLLKPNPVLLEWLSSPIRYRWDDALCARLQAFAERTAYAKACLHHYLGVGERLWGEFVAGRSEVNLKTYFYILRPALCLNWIQARDGEMPPMRLQDLMGGLDLSNAFRSEVDALLERKMASSEVGDGPRIAAFDRYIDEAFTWARARPALGEPDHSLRAEAEALFEQIVRGGA
jgi:predicted nucleotidyltransferase